MFERSKGIKKGLVVAEQTSKATMNIVNHLVSEGVELGTHDTLTICSYFYAYALNLSIPDQTFFRIKGGRGVDNKEKKFMEGLQYQSIESLSSWIVEATGVYEAESAMPEMIDKHWYMVGQIRAQFSLAESQLVKSYFPEKILLDLSNHFSDDSLEFKNLIGKQLENTRIAL